VSETELLSADLTRRLEAQEADPYHIPAARQALEEAVVAQFRAVARGLLADQILRGQVPDDDVWWYQYASLHEPLAAPEPDVFEAGLETLGSMGFQDRTAPWEETQFLFQTVGGSLTAASAKRAAETDRDIPAFREFRKSFPMDVAMRRVRTIAPAEAAEIRIRVYGGEVDLWQEGRINRQLADLGSSIRCAIEGAREYRIRKIRAMVGQDVEHMAEAPLFVLGEAGVASAVARAAFVEIEREFAVSPYLGRAPGFAEGKKAVVRRTVPWRLFGIDPGGHELYHAWTDPDQGSGLKSWHAVLRDDICRYCQTPRKFENIAYQFSRAFGFDLRFAAAMSRGVLSNRPMAGNGYPTGESPEELPLHRIVESLREDELLIVKDGSYYCPLLEEGRRWHLA
jgi:hypothetical protein